jgi:integrase
MVGGKSQIIISDEMKNETSRRTIPMVPMVVEALKRHKARQEFHRQQFKDAYSTKHLNMVCVNAMGDLIKPNYVTTHFAYLLRKYGMRKIRFHDLRHTCASLLLASDNNMKVIQMWMGHSSMKTTADIYAHLDMSAKNTAAVALAHLFRLDEDDEAEE